MNRGRILLIAQRKGRGKPLGQPPTHLSGARLQAWTDIVGSCHDVLRGSDKTIVEFAAIMLAHWRSDTGRTTEQLRLTYRLLGKLLMPMAGRRRLMFGDPRD